MTSAQQTSMFLNRLVVLKKGQRAYDEEYHLGVNIIRGEGNSVGKSTIANMIFYALGGEGVRWVDQALECDTVLAEVSLSGATATLRRAIAQESFRPMAVFWGTLDSAMTAESKDWQEYPFAQHGRDGFSQVLFRALAIPEFRGELGSALTMHQFLRLIFVDQRSPQDTIFRAERFDSAARREMIGEILCGFFDPSIYEKEELLRKYAKDAEDLQTEIRSLRKVLSDTEQDRSVKSIEKDIARVTREREQIEKDAAILSATEQATKASMRKIEKISEDVAEQIRTDLLQAKKELARKLQEREALTLDIADSELFLEALHRKANALQDSTVMWGALGHIEFNICPSCYTVLDGQEVGKCKLCTRALSTDKTQSQISRARQELAQQLRESRELQAMRLRRSETLVGDVLLLEERVAELARQFDSYFATATSTVDQAGSELARKRGYVQRDLEALLEKLRIAKLVESREWALSTLRSDIRTLEEESKAMRLMQNSRRSEASAAIESIAKAILQKDIGGEESFANPMTLSFDFGADSIHVDGRRNFSDSSLVYLKNSFHIAILFASLTVNYMRYPRLVLLDNIEDKGMVPARSQNFQRLVVSLSKAAVQDHQIIFTTSMVDPELNESELTVGEYYTKTNKSLCVAASGASPPVAETPLATTTTIPVRDSAA